MTSLLRSHLAAALLVALLSGRAAALEKQIAPFHDDRADLWRGGAASCALVYWNQCNLWAWVWSLWTPNDRFGVSFTSCCEIGHTTAVGPVFLYGFHGSPSGYGYTGTVDVFDADANMCPTGPSLASLPFLLQADSWNFFDFGGLTVPDRTFAVTATFGPGAGNPGEVGTDHPRAGPTGPQACGFCYPLDRVNHSFYYGTPATPLCPGFPLNDGVCDAQFLMDVDVSCTVSLEPTSWAGVKSLFR